MKYILTHLNGTKKTFKSEIKLNFFCINNKWSGNDFEALLRTNSLFGWSLEIIPETNKEAINLYWNEVYSTCKDSDYDGDLEYFAQNDYKYLAVNLWLGTGASKYNFSVKLPKARMNEEWKHFDEVSDSFKCPHCNHVGVYDYDSEIEIKIQHCYSCNKHGPMESYKNIVRVKKLMSDIAS